MGPEALNPSEMVAGPTVIDPPIRNDRSRGMPALLYEYKSSELARVSEPLWVRSTAARTVNGKAPVGFSRASIAGVTAPTVAAAVASMFARSAGPRVVPIGMEMMGSTRT